MRLAQVFVQYHSVAKRFSLLRGKLLTILQTFFRHVIARKKIKRPTVLQ